jgi:hypothetical protein
MRFNRVVILSWLVFNASQPLASEPLHPEAVVSSGEKVSSSSSFVEGALNCFTSLLRRDRQGFADHVGTVHLIIEVAEKGISLMETPQKKQKRQGISSIQRVSLIAPGLT